MITLWSVEIMVNLTNVFILYKPLFSLHFIDNAYCNRKVLKSNIFRGNYDNRRKYYLYTWHVQTLLIHMFKRYLYTCSSVTYTHVQTLLIHMFKCYSYICPNVTYTHVQTLLMHMFKSMYKLPSSNQSILPYLYS